MFPLPLSLLMIIAVARFVWEKQSYWWFFPPPGFNTGLIQIVVGQDQ